MWQVSLLGKVEARRDGRVLTHFESARAVALLARLALFPQRVHPREELCELLWPEVETEVARGRLRHTLLVLRRQLERGAASGPVILANRTAIRLAPGALETDVAAFERAVRRGDTAAAQALYTGPLLPGLWDDWIVEERNRLEALADQLEAPPVPPVAPTVTLRTEPPPTQHRRPLPTYLTTFFGRDDDRAQLASLLTTARLVTITGLGGTGKTRLSVEFLRTAPPPFTHIGFVALGECLSAAQVPRRLRDALALPLLDTDPLEQVAWALDGVPTLLVLDNLEQLVESGVAELIEGLLARLPELTIITTSRRALGVAGERLLPLAPLPLAPSTALLLDRIQATRPGFTLTSGNRDDIEAVCRGLEGIPLALELAAARIRAFSVAEMRQELQTRFTWLTRTHARRDKDERHHSLAAALEWSWRLLPPSQQQFLAALSVFRAPWTAAAAAAVTDCTDARERLEALVADSLLTSAAADSGETRYHLLETVREYAQPALSDPGTTRSQFCAYYRDLPHYDPNTATAWEYALEDQSGDDAHAFAARIDLDWPIRLGVERAQEFLERTLALSTDDARRRMRATHQLAQCLLRLNRRQEAMARMDAVAAELESAPAALLAETLSFQAHIGLYDAPRDKTLALLARCRSLTQDPFVLAEALRLQGCLLCWTPDYDQAEPLFDEAARLYSPDDPGQRRLLLHRAHLARRRNQFVEALAFYEAGAAAAQATGDGLLYKNCMSNRADLLACVGRWDEALAQGQACLALEEAYGDRHVLLTLLWNLSRPLLALGEPERATRLLSAAATLWEREVRELTPDEHEEIEMLRAEQEQALGPERRQALWDEGSRLSLREALALGYQPVTSTTARAESPML